MSFTSGASFLFHPLEILSPGTLERMVLCSQQEGTQNMPVVPGRKYRSEVRKMGTRVELVVQVSNKTFPPWSATAESMLARRHVLLIVRQGAQTP